MDDAIKKKNKKTHGSIKVQKSYIRVSFIDIKKIYLSLALGSPSCPSCPISSATPYVFLSLLL